MICNKVWIALTALVAVAAAIPFFDLGEYETQIEAEYENNPQLWLNAPLKTEYRPKWGEWGNPNTPNDQQGSEVESEAPESEAPDVEESEAAEVEDDGAGGASSGEQTGGDPAAGGAIGAAGGYSGNPAAAGAGANVAAPGLADEQHVYAAAGPPPGQLKAHNSKAQGLGIATGLGLLVVATTVVAVFAIRHYWRHRL